MTSQLNLPSLQNSLKHCPDVLTRLASLLFYKLDPTLVVFYAVEDAARLEQSLAFGKAGSGQRFVVEIQNVQDFDYCQSGKEG